MDDLAGLATLIDASFPVGGLDFGMVLVEEVTDLTESGPPPFTFTCFELLFFYDYLSSTFFFSVVILAALSSVSLSESILVVDPRILIAVATVTIVLLS